MAKKFATKSRQLSEQAEYSAYLKGGATPEVALQQTSGEGASGDPEESMQKAKSLHEEKEAEKMRIKKESQELQARDHEEPTLQQNHSAEPELEVKEAPKEEKKPDEKKPETPGGYE